LATKTRVFIKLGTSVKSRVTELINNTLQGEKVLNEIGVIAVKSVVQENLKGVNPSNKQQFKSPLTDKWVERKNELDKRTSTKALGPKGLSAKPVNLFTGQFLKSLGYEIVNFEGSKAIEIKATDTTPRVPYSNLDGTKSSVSKNEDIGQGLINRGSDWRGVPQAAVNVITSLINRALRNNLRKKV